MILRYGREVICTKITYGRVFSLAVLFLLLLCGNGWADCYDNSWVGSYTDYSSCKSITTDSDLYPECEELHSGCPDVVFRQGIYFILGPILYGQCQTSGEGCGFRQAKVRATCYYTKSCSNQHHTD